MSVTTHKTIFVSLPRRAKFASCSLRREAEKLWCRLICYNTISVWCNTYIMSSNIQLGGTFRKHVEAARHTLPTKTR